MVFKQDKEFYNFINLRASFQMVAIVMCRLYYTTVFFILTHKPTCKMNNLLIINVVTLHSVFQVNMM